MLGSRYIELSLKHGDRLFSNRVTVKGDDSNWVNGTFTKVKEIIDATRPQENWLLRHRGLTYLLGTAAIWYTLSFLGQRLYEPKPGVQRVAILSWCGFIALALGFELKRWLLDLWPSIEFDFGPEHTRMEKARRGRIVAFLIILGLPMVVNIISIVISRFILGK